MRILLVHQYYKTPGEGGAIRSYYIARHLAAAGHQVEVITAFNEKRYIVKQQGNISVHYLPVYYTNHLSFLSRIHAFYRFVRQAIRLIKKLQPADLNYVITTPLTTGIIALIAKRKFGTPYIFEVGDLWPDAPIALGVLKNPLLKKLAYQLERRSYAGAAALVALSPDIKAAISEKVPEKEVVVVTNMADTNFFQPQQKKASLVEQYAVQGKFVISYAGTVGMANHLEYLLDVAEQVQLENSIHFIVAGSGARWEPVKRQAEQRQLHNISFIDFLDKEGVRDLLNISDAVFISFENVPVLATGSPNKLFDGLAAGKLIIINFGGWIKELIEQHQCGFSYPPQEPKVFVEMLQPFLKDNTALIKAQEGSRQLAEAFTPEVQLEKLTALITRLQRA